MNYKLSDLRTKTYQENITKNPVDPAEGHPCVLCGMPIQVKNFHKVWWVNVDDDEFVKEPQGAPHPIGKNCAKMNPMLYPYLRKVKKNS